MTSLEQNAFQAVGRSLPTISSTLARIAEQLEIANKLKAIEMGIYQDGVFTPNPLVAKVMEGGM